MRELEWGGEERRRLKKQREKRERVERPAKHKSKTSKEHFDQKHASSCCCSSSFPVAPCCSIALHALLSSVRTVDTERVAKRKRELSPFEFGRPGVVNSEGKKTPMSARWRALARAVGPIASSSTSGGLSASLSQAQVRVFLCGGRREKEGTKLFDSRRRRGGSLVGGRAKALFEPVHRGLSLFSAPSPASLPGGTREGLFHNLSPHELKPKLNERTKLTGSLCCCVVTPDVTGVVDRQELRRSRFLLDPPALLLRRRRRRRAPSARRSLPSAASSHFRGGQAPSRGSSSPERRLPRRRGRKR